MSSNTNLTISSECEAILTFSIILIIIPSGLITILFLDGNKIPFELYNFEIVLSLSEKGYFISGAAEVIGGQVHLSGKTSIDLYAVR